MAGKAAKKAAKRSERGTLISKKAGADGARIAVVPVKTKTQAVSTQYVRARPGSFEWIYGRAGSELYHAGSDFARQYERAGIANTGSVLSPDAAGGPGWRGLPDGRCVAVDWVTRVTKSIGSRSGGRLVAFCVEGKTTPEMATAYGFTQREMGAILKADLKALAEVIGYANAA